MTWLYTLVGLVTIESIVIVLTKRHVIRGLKLWFYRKFRKNPVEIKYLGPDNNLEEYIIVANGEYVQAGKKIFNINPKKIKHSPDQIPVLFYNWKSCVSVDMDEIAMPLPGGGFSRTKAEEIQAEAGVTADQMKRFRVDLKNKVMTFMDKRLEGLSQEFLDELTAVFDPIDPQTIDVNASPEALNKFAELVDMEAKKNADEGINKLVKYGKWAVIAIAGAAIMAFMTYNIINGTIAPQVEQILGTVQSIANNVHALTEAANVAPPIADQALNTSITV